VTRKPRARSGDAPPVSGVVWDDRHEEPLLSDPEDVLPFNPLDTKNLAIAVVRALLEKRARPLGDFPTFRGAGIYAIYYAGAFPAYQLIAAENRERERPRWPIYIGRAQPPGGRRGGFNLDSTNNAALHNRLREHADSIRSVGNLEVSDFSCRFLVVQDLWIPLAEQLLISHFTPVWNRLIDGFGNHDPGSGRYQGYCPRWDMLHPGRSWAAKCKPRVESTVDVERETVQYLSGAAVPSLSVLSGDLTFN
jgi:Eco29kI restriction endonuclease